MKSLLLLASFLVCLVAQSQDESLGFGFNQSSTAKKDTFSTYTDTTRTLDFNSTNKGVIEIHQDQRVANITEFIGRHRESIEGPKIDGYRIQIFFNESRSIAQSQKASFLSAHNEHKAYIDYLAPNYRIRVGNFRTRLHAEKFKLELISIYPSCIVIKDKIELPVITLSSDSIEK